ncbi:VOC family protein [Rhizobium lemnae]|uniref:VOC family protein n=1 Tax=Rhizobium lemnae TaxID=1214924 RepID=A0ABV8E5M9_9HYPH|nr:VOC family protein [Rhizobium lemnae]MCJ8507642.1 VOC family protein [Rhizobium lemnae]
MMLAHINLVARNVETLAAFYVNVMGCIVFRELRTLSGEHVSRGNGVSKSEIRTIWLKFPHLERPLLEIHEHKVMHHRDEPKVNEPGFGHLAFQMENVGDALRKIIDAGGAQIGQTTDFGTPANPYLIAYARDPEGNILELEQAIK